MGSPNKKLINIFRAVFVLLLFLTIYNGAISDSPRFSAVSSWGEFWQGLFLTAAVSWAIVEAVNFFSKKTKLGQLPAYFWGVTAGLNGADFFNNYTLLFEIPYFDKFAHTLGGFLGGIVVLGLIKLINNKYSLNLSKALIVYLTVATLNMLGILYEVGELVGDAYFGATNITGPLDTTSDIVFNNLGLFLVIGIDYLLSILKRARATKHV